MYTEAWYLKQLNNLSRSPPPIKPLGLSPYPVPSPSPIRPSPGPVTATSDAGHV